MQGERKHDDEQQSRDEGGGACSECGDGNAEIVERSVLVQSSKNSQTKTKDRADKQRDYPKRGGRFEPVRDDLGDRAIGRAVGVSEVAVSRVQQVEAVLLASPVYPDRTSG